MHLYRRRDDPVAVIREGEGPDVLLVHGGASPETTWRALAPLRARWTLALVYRRGYPPSPPPPEGRQDFEVDAADVASLLDARPHIVAHSYGVLGTLIAATRAPARVRSLTLIEPPLYYLVPGDPEVARLERMGNAVLTDGVEADAATLREFLRLAGASEVDDGPLQDKVARGVRRAHGGRLPGEARPALELIRDAGIPRLWPRAVTLPGSSGSATRSPQSSMPDGWSRPAPGTSSLRRRPSSTGSTSSSSPQRERPVTADPVSP
jgi:pimeloyl-ACP methyl ester carboxylesterase